MFLLGKPVLWKLNREDVSLIYNSEFSLTNIPIYMRAVIKCKSYCFIFSRGQGIRALGLEKSCLMPAHGADS